MPLSALPELGLELGAALDVKGLVIAYPGAGVVLRVPSLHLAHGSATAIEGPSGAGKSSLLHALAGIERPVEGSVRWGSDDLWTLQGARRDRWRRERLGLVFQDMHLLDGLSALDNVLLPTLFDHARVPTPLRAHAAALLDMLGVKAWDRRVAAMSRGERQRIALARALLRRPAVLLADEPTASLDATAAAQVGDLLLHAAAEAGATLVIATHDPALLARLPRRLLLRAGELHAT